MDVFHGLFNRISDYPIEANTGTFGLMDRVAVEAMNRLPERHRFFSRHALVGGPSAPPRFFMTGRNAPPASRSKRSSGSPAMPSTGSSAFLPAEEEPAERPAGRVLSSERR